MILAYVPGPDYNLAADQKADYHRAATWTGEQPVFLLGYFSRCDITTMLPNLETIRDIPHKTGQNARPLLWEHNWCIPLEGPRQKVKMYQNRQNIRQ